MTVLVCGSRRYKNKQRVYEVLDELLETYNITTIIHGNCEGADLLSDMWATERSIHVVPYPAEWFRRGRAAGPIRNTLMLETGRPDIVIAFPGNTGTQDLIDKAIKRKITVKKIFDEEFIYDDRKDANVCLP